MLRGKENNNNNKNNKCDPASGSFKSSLRASSPFREMSKMKRESKTSCKSLRRKLLQSHLNSDTPVWKWFKLFWQVHSFCYPERNNTSKMKRHLKKEKKNTIRLTHGVHSFVGEKRERDHRFIRQRLPQLWKWKAKFRLNRIDQSNRTNSRG